MNDRIVITGFGIVSALGIGIGENLSSLRAGNSGIGVMKHLNSSHKEFPVGEVRLSNKEMCEMLGIPFHRYVSRTQLLGALAVREAISTANLANKNGMALVSGTTVGGMDVTESLYPLPFPADKPAVHDCGSNTNSIADLFGCFDYTSTLSTACSSALNSIILGRLLIESGLKDIVIAGGTEALSVFHLNGFKSLMILDEQRCRPFDVSRAGLNLGEGAAFVVLESEVSALKRKATVLGTLSGVGNACDAYHQTASSQNGEGACLAMTQALESASLKPSDISYISAHGTGTPDNDAAESAAIRRIFGDNYPPTASTKALTGHTTSASGSIETVFCLLALLHNFMPKSTGFANPDEKCIIPYTGNGHGETELKHILCNAFGFGGNDSSIIISKYE